MWVVPVVCAINKDTNEVLGWRRGAADIHSIVVRVATGDSTEATELAGGALADFFDVPHDQVVCIEGAHERRKKYVLPIDEETLIRLLP